MSQPETPALPDSAINGSTPAHADKETIAHIHAIVYDLYQQLMEIPGVQGLSLPMREPHITVFIAESVFQPVMQQVTAYLEKHGIPAGYQRFDRRPALESHPFVRPDIMPLCRIHPHDPNMLTYRKPSPQ